MRPPMHDLSAKRAPGRKSVRVQALNLANHRHLPSRRRRTGAGLVNFFELAGSLRRRNRADVRHRYSFGVLGDRCEPFGDSTWRTASMILLLEHRVWKFPFQFHLGVLRASAVPILLESSALSARQPWSP